MNISYKTGIMITMLLSVLYPTAKTFSAQQRISAGLEKSILSVLRVKVDRAIQEGKNHDSKLIKEYNNLVSKLLTWNIIVKNETSKAKVIWAMPQFLAPVLLATAPPSVTAKMNYKGALWRLYAFDADQQKNIQSPANKASFERRIKRLGSSTEPKPWNVIDIRGIQVGASTTSLKALREILTRLIDKGLTVKIKITPGASKKGSVTHSFGINWWDSKSPQSWVQDAKAKNR